MTQAVCSQELTLCSSGVRRVTVLGLSVTAQENKKNQECFEKRG